MLGILRYALGKLCDLPDSSYGHLNGRSKRNGFLMGVTQQKSAHLVTWIKIRDELCAENCIVAAEGKLQHDGKFKVQALGMPPNERRDESLTAAKVVLLQMLVIGETRNRESPSGLNPWIMSMFPWEMKYFILANENILTYTILH